MDGLDYFAGLWRNPYVKRAVKGSAIIFIVAIIASIIGYFIRIVLSRQLSLEDFGLFYAVLTFVLSFSMFKDLGLNQALVKFIPEFLVKKRFSDIKSIIIYVIATNLISVFFVAVLWFFMSNFLSINFFNNIAASKLILILSIYFILDAVSDFFAAVCLGFQKHLFYSLKLLIINSLVFIGIFVFSGFGVLAPAISYLAAAFLALFVYFFFFVKSFKIPESSFMFSGYLYGSLFRFGAPLLIANFSNILIGSFSVLLLTYFRSLSEVGIFSVVLPTAALFSLIGGSLSVVLLPLISEMLIKKKNSEIKVGLGIIYRYLGFIIFIGASIILLLSDKIMVVLFGSDFGEGSIPLKILIVGAAFGAVASINNSVISATGETTKVTKVVFLSSLVNVVVCVLLVPILGMVGASISVALSQIVMFIISCFFINKTL